MARPVEIKSQDAPRVRTLLAARGPMSRVKRSSRPQEAPQGAQGGEGLLRPQALAPTASPRSRCSAPACTPTATGATASATSAASGSSASTPRRGRGPELLGADARPQAGRGRGQPQDAGRHRRPRPRRLSPIRRARPGGAPAPSRAKTTDSPGRTAIGSALLFGEPFLDHIRPQREAHAGPPARGRAAPRARGALRRRGRGPARGGLAAGAEPRFVLCAPGRGSAARRSSRTCSPGSRRSARAPA